MTAKPSEAEGVDRNLTTYGDPAFSRYLRRAYLASAGFDSDDFARPLIGIVDTSSDYNPCHRQMPELAHAVKRGVLEAGGLPFVFPTMSLGETLLSPTSMLLRNLMAMETEELIRAQPMDAVVLLGGCDKTVPAQLMAAASANVPALLVVTGPMLTDTWRAERLAACTDCRRYWLRYRAGELSTAEIDEVQSLLAATAGTCAVMGTASTMACIAETLGMSLIGGAMAPAASGARLRHAARSGRRVVGMARESLRPLQVLTRSAFLNAVTVLSAISGSTNAIIHLLAIARRAGTHLSLDDFDLVARRVPLLVNCKPAGEFYAEDFYRAGGVPSLLKVLEPLLDISARRVDGGTLQESLADVPLPMQQQRCIATLAAPFGPPETLAILRGSLAPDGAVLKVAAASRRLLDHRGPALVFESPDDAARKLNDPDLDVTPDHVLVLRNAGPVAAAMPEAGTMAIPIRLAAQGLTDMVRISDARMSGTAYGTVVLHCSPEAARQGPLAFVRNGDVIHLDVANRRLDLLIDESELVRRRATFQSPGTPKRGWARLYAERVLPAHLGADLDFLTSTGDQGS